MKAAMAVILAQVAMLVGSVAAADAPRGLWLTARKDARNQARADVAGRMTEAPREIWSYGTGGAVYFARNVQIEGQDAALMQVGSTMQLVRWDGQPIWRLLKLGVGQVLRVDDFDGAGGPD